MATGATEFIDNTTADAFIPEHWSKKAQIAREQQLFFANVFDRQYESELEAGDILNVTPVGNLTAQTKSANTAIVYETETPTNIQITVNVNEYSAFALETKTKKQSHMDLAKKYAPKQGYACGLAIDDVGAGLPDDFGTSPQGVLGTPTSYSDWLRAQQALDDALVPLKGRFMGISPAERKNLMEMDQFIHADFSKLQDATAPPAVTEAKIGTWMNMPVYMSTNIEGSNAAGHDNFMAHKEALALIVQIDMPSYYFFDIDYFAHKYAVETLYGWKEMRDDHGCFVRGA